MFWPKRCVSHYRIAKCAMAKIHVAEEPLDGKLAVNIVVHCINLKVVEDKELVHGKKVFITSEG